MREIEVKNNDVRYALGLMKKRLKLDGLFDELREREHFTPPSKARRLKSDRAKAMRVREAAKNKRYE